MMIYSGIRGIFIIEWKSIPRHMNPFWDTIPMPRRKTEKPVGPNTLPAGYGIASDAD